MARYKTKIELLDHECEELIRILERDAQESGIFHNAYYERLIEKIKKGLENKKEVIK